MSATYDVIVVGGGLEGLSVAHSLAQRGVDNVLVLERHTLCSGATAKSSGVARAHYGVPSLVAMAWHGIQVMEDAHDRLGADIGFRQPGYVVGVGPDDVDALAANTAMQRSIGVPVESVSHDDVAAMWPAAFLDDFAAFAYEPRGGCGDAYRTGMAFAASARRAGVQIEQHVTVVDLVTGPAGAVTGVELGDGSRRSADHVVLAAGAWSVPLAARIGVRLPIRSQREQILLFGPGQDLGPVPVLSDLVTLAYLRPEVGGEVLFGNSDHSTPQYADPDTYANRADGDFIDVAVAKIAHRLPQLTGAHTTSSYAGCYDVTPDFNPVIDSTVRDGLTICAGFSGHGFKIAPAVGRLVADVVCDGKSSDPLVHVDDFALSRFADGRPLTSEHPYRSAGQMR
ncbi:MAG: NAD(P)/FAD-dependent oxidoreductase [Nocardioidaceae bacterium]